MSAPSAPSALSSGDLRNALRKAGTNPEVRAQIIAMLRKQEALLAAPGFNVREEVTGPIVDALYEEGELVERTLDSGVRISFPYRSKIARDFVIAADERPDHVWEPQTTKLLLAIGKRARTRTVVIGGAYFGDQAIPLAHVLASHGGVCHCFEINDEEISVLERNAKLNSLTNVVVSRLGLYDEDDRKLVLVGDDSHAYSREASADELGRAVPTITIDSYARQNQLPSVDLIMLDIEGGEHAALRGAKAQLAMPADKSPLVIFEVHRSYVDWSRGLDKTEIVEQLTQFGYHVFGIRDHQSNVDMRGRPIELVPVDNIYLDGPPHGFNMFATKDRAVLDELGLRLTPGVSPKLLFHRDPQLHHPLS